MDSFRLLTEYHSFLLSRMIKKLNKYFHMFPSPYGVSFILIIRESNYMLTQMPVSVSLRSIVHSYLKEVTNEELSKCIASFRLLTEYRSFLWYESYAYSS